MRLGERYEVLHQLGRGDTAVVYYGRDTQTGRPVAIKILRDIYSSDHKWVVRFQRGAKATASLEHPNIVQVYDYGQSEGHYFIVMELVEGNDLRHYVRPRGTLDSVKAMLIAHDVAQGLGYMHDKGAVHGSLSLSKVLIGRGGAVKLIGFGMGAPLPTHSYAPEQALGEFPTPAADIYVLGSILYEMLTGHAVFPGDEGALHHIQDAPTPPSVLAPHISKALETLILRCLAKAPEQRFQDGNEVARALADLPEYPPNARA